MTGRVLWEMVERRAENAGITLLQLKSCDKTLGTAQEGWVVNGLPWKAHFQLRLLVCYAESNM